LLIPIAGKFGNYPSIHFYNLSAKSIPSPTLSAKCSKRVNSLNFCLPNVPAIWYAMYYCTRCIYQEPNSHSTFSSVGNKTQVQVNDASMALYLMVNTTTNTLMATPNISEATTISHQDVNANSNPCRS